MARLLTLLVVFSVCLLANGLRFAPSRPRQCLYQSHCSLKLSWFCNPVKDRYGCPLKNCPCGISPPVLKKTICPQCFTYPCPCECPTLSCPKNCGNNGWEKDASGCNTCKCKPKPCPLLKCQYCPNGYVQENGCQTCKCKPQKLPCPAVLCRHQCPNGYASNEHGCQTCQCKKSLNEHGCEICQCKKSPVCSPVRCKLGCPNGFAVDKHGCEICKCKPTKVCPPVCAIYCEHGNVPDRNGCPTCTCKPAPSPTKCLYESDCAAVTCLGSPKRDANGCSLRGCPCGSGPVAIPLQRG